MSLLYVIGNGFDRWHELPTSYNDNFKCLVKEKYPKEAEYLEKLFSTGNAEDLWGHFEKRVGSVTESAQEGMRNRASDSLSWFVEEANNNGVVSDDRDPAMQLDDHVITIDSAVPDFDKLYPDLDETLLWGLRPILDDCMRKMAAHANGQLANVGKKGLFKKESYFISFNYTDTLESVYSIPSSQVLHIHGRLFDGDELVWGNEESKVEEEHVNLSIPCSELIDRDEPTDCDSGDYRCYLGYQRQCEAAREGANSVGEAGRDASKLLKDVCSGFIKRLNLAELDCFLSAIPGDIDGIIVLGHSLGNVDLPYFERIADFTGSQAPWSFSYYGLNEIARIVEVAGQLSISNLLIGGMGRIAF